MEPRQPALPRPVALRLAAAEYDRCTELFRSLTPAQWATRTDRRQRPELALDAIDFCRAISRRPASLTLDDLLNTEVPY